MSEVPSVQFVKLFFSEKSYREGAETTITEVSLNKYIDK